jgi:hypothetical protein
MTRQVEGPPVSSVPGSVRGGLNRKQLLLLLLLTLGALLVHGYHPWAEDAEIYIPGVEKLLHSELFPFGAEFFQSHASLTLFPNLLAALVRATHLPLEQILFFVHLASIFLLLLACWELSGKCFADPRARWGGVGLIAALLTLPVAGTALYIMDQYVNPRNLAAFASIFSIARILDKKYVQAALFLILAAAIHPFMATFGLFYSVLLVATERLDLRFAGFASLLPFGIAFESPSKAYHEVALLHSFHYLLRWHWYEWLGIVGPLVILWWFSRVARSKQWRNLDLLCRALIPYQLICTVAALALSIPARLESLARIQPLRSLYLLYILFVLFGGGLLAEYVLKNRVWRWLALYGPLCAGMFLAQRALFPASAHIEWPGAAPKNPWVQAFVWIRENTPSGAIFALDPLHMQIPGEDANGFRAIAQRSMLADAVKDSGAVSMFPPMAEEWLRQVRAQSGWRNLRAEHFGKLRVQYSVSWVVLQKPGVPGMRCPYQNSAVLVCSTPALQSPASVESARE